ncbi:ctenidin-3-like [Mytilus trossulus]|uniref:ctenidin-3-like n=1 Tax=Mytilus trossulus TaxID=6551 RepID=UPI0030073047
MNTKCTSVVVAVLLLVNSIAAHGGYGPVGYSSGGYGGNVGGYGPAGYGGGYGGNVGGYGPVGYGGGYGGGLGGIGGFGGILSSGLSSGYANPSFWMKYVPKQYAGIVQKYATGNIARSFMSQWINNNQNKKYY